MLKTASTKPLLGITAFTLTTALGNGQAENLSQLQLGESGLRENDLGYINLPTWFGQVDGVSEQQLPAGLAAWKCRNNQLLELGLLQDGFLDACAKLVARYGADRIGLFVGTSTSGIQAAEDAFKERSINGSELDFNYLQNHNMYSAVSYLRKRLGISGPGFTTSTACSSSAKIFAVAHRHIQAGLCDAAIVVGVDSLCQMTFHGFNSLQLLSAKPCRPADQSRDGISIGEAMAAAIVEPFDKRSEACLLGYGESSDAWHMSSPHPEGAGAIRAMHVALTMAGLSAEQVDYVNLHGTGTQVNDLVEDRAMSAVFGQQAVVCSSTKGFTGHTLGAAGLVEALISVLAVKHEFFPISANTLTLDAQINAQINLPGSSQKPAGPKIIMTNSFGFGGSNATLILAGGYR